MIRDHIEHLTDRITDEAKDRAQDAKMWVATNGTDARPSHRNAHGQTIPESIPYQLDQMTYVPGRRKTGRGGDSVPGAWSLLTGVDLADRPRDPQLPIHQRINCECQSVPVPGVIAAATRALPTRVRGTRVVSGVEVVFPRIAEAEFGTNEVPGTHSLILAASLVLARRR